MHSAGLKIVAIGAHTGDPLELCGGTLAKHVRRGDDAEAEPLRRLSDVVAELGGADDCACDRSASNAQS